MDPDPQLLFVSFLTIDYELSINCFTLIILLISSALISGTEVAFFSLSQVDVDDLFSKNEKDTVVKLLQKPKKLLATILITNNFINILIVLLFASLGEQLLENFDYSIFGIKVRFLIEVVLVTFLILLFGEVLPKVYASRKAVRFASFMSKPVQVLNTLLTPLSYPLINLTNIVEKSLGSKTNIFSVETLSQALELTSKGATTKDEQKILEGIVSFGNTETVQIMKPRIDIFALSDDENYEFVLDKILKNGYSRNPVYHENIDNIIGVLYAKDLLAHLNKKTFKMAKITSRPTFCARK